MATESTNRKAINMRTYPAPAITSVIEVTVPCATCATPHVFTLPMVALANSTPLNAQCPVTLALLCIRCSVRGAYAMGPCDAHSTDVWAGAPRH